MDNTVLELQKRLNKLGYGPLKEDNQYGKNTADAYKAYLDDIDPDTPTIYPTAESKWWMSKPFIGALATILVSIIGIFGYTLDSELLTQIIFSLLTLSTGVYAAVNTIKNKSAIDTTNVNPFKRVRNVSPDDDPRGLFRDQ